MRGQSLIILVILVGGIILAGGVTLAVVTLSNINSTYGFQAAQQAESVASAGIDDGLLQLARNGAFSSAGYSLPVGSSTATVVVTQASNLATITSAATVSSHTRTIKVTAAVNATANQVTVISRVEQ